jgi:hypothetical protein
MFMIQPLDSIMESRRIYEKKEAKKRFTVVTIDEKIQILDILRGGMSGVTY